MSRALAFELDRVEFIDEHGSGLGVRLRKDNRRVAEGLPNGSPRT